MSWAPPLVGSRRCSTDTRSSTAPILPSPTSNQSPTASGGNERRSGNDSTPSTLPTSTAVPS